MRRLFFDATSSVKRAFGRMTGIERVEDEIGRRLSKLGAQPVWFDDRSSTFKRVDQRFFELSDAVDEISLEGILSAPTIPSQGAGWKRALALLAASAYPHMPRKGGLHWHTERAALHLFGSSYRSMEVSSRERFIRSFGLSASSPLMRKLGVAIVGSEKWKSLLDVPLEFSDHDALVSCAIWAPNQVRSEFLNRNISAKGLKYVHMIHDLIPLRHPEYVPRNFEVSVFEQFVNSTIQMADTLITNSSFVAQDVKRYCQENRMSGPNIIPVPLAHAALAAKPQATPRLSALHDEAESFVLNVGTFSPRKNQAWLYQLWKRVVDVLGDRAPALVFAGQLGWGHEELVRAMEADPMWNRKIFLVEAPSDPELAWLYQNCSFTLFPSLYEGWGLPVGESLALGKYCLVADNTALREAGAGLVFCSPLSEEIWLHEIVKLVQEPSYLQTVTAQVSQTRSLRPWDDVASDIYRLCTS